MLRIMEKEDVECEPFIDAIKKEEAVKKSGLAPIPRDLVWMAMRSGVKLRKHAPKFENSALFQVALCGCQGENVDTTVKKEMLRRFCSFSLGNYDARMRVLAQYVALKLSVRWEDVENFERMTVRLLKAQEHEMTECVL